MTESPLTSAVSTATVTTERPGRYGKQLVAHLSRRSVGEWDEQAETGWIEFGDNAGRAQLHSSPGSLDITITADPEHLVRLEDVVGRHLVRFGTKDELVVSWVRADGTPGTQWHNAGDE